MKHLCIPVICFFFATSAFGQEDVSVDVSTYETQQKILNTLLDPEIYNPKIPPGQPDVSPVEIRATMYILDISSVDDFKNEFSMMVYFRQRWTDPRLAFDGMETGVKYLRVQDVERLWKPDSFFVHEREGKLHTVMMPNYFMRIYPDGDVLFSVRLSMTFTCNMDFRYYPLDSQKCHFIVESYGSQAKEISYRWENRSRAVSLNDKIDMPDFAVTDHKYFSKQEDFQHGSYVQLRLDLTFKRKVGLFVNKLYVPFVILVIASWLSFWIKPQFTSLRLTLILAILFIMFWLESGVSRHTPPVSYTMAIDVWTGVCLSLVFASLLQFIFVSQLVRKEKHTRQQHSAVDPESLSIQPLERLEKSSSLDSADVKAASQLIARNLSEGKQLYDKIDTFSRFVFPIFFAVFNLIYWPVYCSGA